MLEWSLVLGPSDLHSIVDFINSLSFLIVTLIHCNSLGVLYVYILYTWGNSSLIKFITYKKNSNFILLYQLVGFGFSQDPLSTNWGGLNVSFLALLSHLQS